MRPPQLTVIGAGASGMFAAITAARLGCKVRILEATRQPMKKILKSGGGRFFSLLQLGEIASFTITKNACFVVLPRTKT